jgi:hypothetical protein
MQSETLQLALESSGATTMQHSDICYAAKWLVGIWVNLQQALRLPAEPA